MQIEIQTSELGEMHPAFERGATSNVLYHIINHTTTELIATIVQKNIEWCEIRGNGGFQFEFGTRFPTRTACLEYVLGKHGIRYNEIVRQDDDTGEIVATHKQGKTQQRDEFGFSINSKAHLFCDHLAACGSAGTTMEAVKDTDWNTDKSVFFWVLARLIKDGKAVKKGKQFYLLAAMEKEPVTATKSKLKPVPVATTTTKPKLVPVPVVGKRRKLNPV